MLIIHFFAWIIPITLLPAVFSIFYSKHPTCLRFFYSFFTGLSGLSAIIVGLFPLMTSRSLSFQLSLGFPGFHSMLYLDPLSGFFLFITGLISSLVAIYSYSYFRHYQSNPSALVTLYIFSSFFVAGMYLVLLANDLLTFLFAWEIMSLSSYFLVAHQHQQAENRHAAMWYLIMAHLSGLLILLGLCLLSNWNNSWYFQNFTSINFPKGLSNLVFISLLVGFGTKAGLVPLHVWLPKAHPVAPSPISALMSGVMIKIAVYGFIRFCFFLSHQFYWQWGMIVLGIGCLSALLGVLYALMQHDLKRLLAYHSVENIGIIFMGIGLSMIFFSLGFPLLASLGLIAALYHVLNHAIFKSLLFLGAGTITQHTHEQDIEYLGGLIHTMPILAFFFLIGCLSIAALPPFNGFVSEWLIFQATIQSFVLKSGMLRALIPLAAAGLALTTALASVCFVKVFGIIFLGNSRSKSSGKSHHMHWTIYVSLGILAACCLIFGIFPTALISLLNSITILFFHQRLSFEAGHPWLWISSIHYHDTSYQPLIIFLSLIIFALIVFIIFRLYCPFSKSKRVPAWDCGFGGLTSRMQYTATAFAMPLRKLFQSLWMITEKKPMVSKENNQWHYEVTLDDRIEHFIYTPINRWILMISKQLARIQGGNIRAYLAYSLLALLILLWIVSCNLFY